MSNRQKAAEEIADFALDLKNSRGGSFFNGPINGYKGKRTFEKSSGKYHLVILMVARLLDLEIRVTSTSNIWVRGEGPLWSGSRTFDSVENVKDWLESEIVK